MFHCQSINQFFIDERVTRNRKHRRAAAKPAACAQHPNAVNTRREEEWEGGAESFIEVYIYTLRAKREGVAGNMAVAGR